MALVSKLSWIMITYEEICSFAVSQQYGLKWIILPSCFIMKNFRHPVSCNISTVNTCTPHLGSAINIFTVLSIISQLSVYLCNLSSVCEFISPLPLYLSHIYLHSSNIFNRRLCIAYRICSLEIATYTIQRIAMYSSQTIWACLLIFFMMTFHDQIVF